MRTFIPFDEARQIVLESVAAMESETVSLEASLHRTLSSEVVSRDLIPPFDNSAMDGFAVIRVDVLKPPVALKIVADIPAGTTWAGRLEKGSCARIMTGAPVPEGADAIVPVEQTTTLKAGMVRIDTTPGMNAHFRRAGEDLGEGEIVFESGTLINPGVIGMLATLGVTAVPARRRPRVAVFSTGDEIVSPYTSPGPGQIRNTNGPAISAQVVSAGGIAHPVLHVSDDKRSIREAVEGARDADVLVLAGGVSMGEHDHVRSVLDAMGTEWSFWKVRQRPGKPLAFGQLDGRPVLGLPGNPVSAAMCFEMYARPMMAKMLGRRNVFRPLLTATLSGSMKKVGGLYYFARGILEKQDAGGRILVRQTGPQGSHLFSSVARADCILHLPEEMEDPDAGTEVFVEKLGW